MFVLNTLLALTILVASVSTKSAETLKRAAPSDEYNCKIDGTTMTPKTRKLAVDLANAYRTLATTGVFGYPPSQNMYQLEYSCLAEEYAIVICNQQAPLNPMRNLSSIPIAAAFELWWGNHDFGAFINSTAVYDPTFDYTLFSQMVAGYAVGIGCTDTCYGEKSVFCSFLQCTAMSDFGMIYEVGSGPCMIDDDCSTFPDSTCNQNNGLCVKKPNTSLCPPGVYPNV
uniref:SCP domain-containing protein n=1 Tax=Haemonchus contortus TaxID=6289 RepID=A0A6F7Q4K0_HAECO|nr:venom allergen/ancylostoma secreted protein-like [Haemonchus contortus]